MAKQKFTSVLFRDLSPEESKLIHDTMKLLDESTATKALLKAAKGLPLQKKRIEKLEEDLVAGKEWIDELQYLVGRFIESQEMGKEATKNLAEILKKQG